MTRATPTLTERHAASVAYQDAKRELDRIAAEPARHARGRNDFYCAKRRKLDPDYECFCGGGCADWNL